MRDYAVRNGGDLDWPTIEKTPINDLIWRSPEDLQPSIQGLCKEIGMWAWAFANKLFPDEGLELESALHAACLSRLGRGLVRLSRNLSIPDPEAVYMDCRTVCEDAQNCHLMGQEGGQHRFLVEGHQLEGNIRKDIQTKAKTGPLNEEEQAILNGLDQLWVSRKLPDKLPKPLTESARLNKVEIGDEGAYRPLKWASQAVHGTSRWLEEYDLTSVEATISNAIQTELYCLRQKDPPIQLAIVSYTVNRGFSAIQVLARSTSGLTKNVIKDLTDLERRISRVTRWLQVHSS